MVITSTSHNDEVGEKIQIYVVYTSWRKTRWRYASGYCEKINLKNLYFIAILITMRNMCFSIIKLSKNVLIHLIK